MRKLSCKKIDNALAGGLPSMRPFRERRIDHRYDKGVLYREYH
jgi:hypothetical protein